MVRNNVNASVPSIACMTVERQKIVTAVIQSRLKNDFRLKQRYVDGWTLTAARWESSWDGIHYSLLLNENTLHSKSTGRVIHYNDSHTCNGIYLKGSSHIMCQQPLGIGWTPIKHFKGVNRCETNFDSTGEAMYWCRNVVALNKNFHYFEGGVSRMLTNVFLNMACNN
mmetsp:Transcript_30658/g.41990  ORF Transcript_30658/g.41990 Transcript_30658/m.41990 type:complete len:168 (+) Transcript_30658:211-714(+)